MIEKNNDYILFEKKITPYLDGTLSQEEISEFEAYILTHPEFEERINVRRSEIQDLRKLIPVAIVSQTTLESIQNEMRSSIFNLLKEEPKGIIDRLRIRWEEWRTR
jgi:anti-sigma factor RsiW